MSHGLKRERIWRVRGFFLGAGLTLASALLAAGCSPSSFFGSGVDTSVTNLPTYRKINTSCSGLTLNSATIDVPTLRAIVACFNSQGGLQQVQDLVASLSDAELTPAVNTLNKYFMNDPTVLFDLESSFYTLDQMGIVATTFQQLGNILSNSQFVASAIALLGEKLGVNLADPDLPQAFQLLAPKLSVDNVGIFIDAAMSLTSSKAYLSLESEFTPTTSSSLQSITDGLSAFFQGFGNASHAQTLDQLLATLGNGTLLPALDPVFGVDVPTMSANIPRVSSFFDVTMGSDGSLFSGLNTLLNVMNGPIPCMETSETVPNGDLYVIEELSVRATSGAANFLKETAPTTLMALAPFCTLPAGLAPNYHFMTTMATSTAVEPMVDLMKALYSIQQTDASSGAVTHPAAASVVNLLADPLMLDLLPALLEVTNRGAWNDLLLVPNLIPVDKRPIVQSMAAFLSAPQPTMNGRTLMDVFVSAIGHTDPANLYNLFSSLRPFIEQSNPIILPALTSLRAAFYANNVHPLVSVVQNILQDAPSNQAFFISLFNIAANPKFAPAVQLISQMGQDGRLRSLVGDIVTLFNNFAQKGSHPILAMTQPPFTPSLRVNIASADLNVVVPGIEPSTAAPACSQLDLSVSLADYTSTDFSNQLNLELSCINSDGSEQAVVTAVNFLNSQTTSDGRTYLDLGIDLLKTMNLTSNEEGYLTNSFLSNSLAGGAVTRLLGALPYWITQSLPGTSNGTTTNGPWLQPLFSVINAVMTQAESGVHGLDLYLAQILPGDTIPSIIAYGQKLWNIQTGPDPTPVQQGFDTDRIKRWVGNKECENLPSGATAVDTAETARMEQIINYYVNDVTNWDLGPDGQPRTSWSLGEFQTDLAAILPGLGSTNVNIPNKHVIDAVTNILNYFTLPDTTTPPNTVQHFQKDALLNWFWKRTNDPKLVTYFYINDANPRVRLVNTLDRLEILLVSADFVAPWPFEHNYSLKFMGELAEAWGDEDRANWPLAIQQKFPPGSTPPMKLSDVVKDIESTQALFEDLMGFPAQPTCTQVANPNDPPALQLQETTNPKADGLIGWAPISGSISKVQMQEGIFNLHQVISVLQENLPTATDPGLKVLRDLFFEIYYSTPEQNRGDLAGDANNLSLVLKAVRMGLAREVGKKLMQFSSIDAPLTNFWRAIIDGGTAPDVDLVFNPLVVTDPSYSIVNSIVKEVFGIEDAATGQNLDPNYQAEIAGKTPDQVATIEAGWAQQEALMRQMVYYGLVDGEEMGISQPVISSLGAIFTNYPSFFSMEGQRIQNALRTAKPSYLLRALGDDQDPANQAAKTALGALTQGMLSNTSNATNLMSVMQAIFTTPAAATGWDQFWSRADALDTIPGYTSLNMTGVGDQILGFFEETSGDPNAIATERRLRSYLSERLTAGDVEQLLLLASSKPDDSYQIMTMLSQEAQNGDLNNFIQMVRRSLSQ